MRAAKEEDSRGSEEADDEDGDNVTIANISTQ
jgi:hypothetical protein